MSPSCRTIFSFSSKVYVLVYFFRIVICQNSKIQYIWHVLFFFLTNIKSGRLAGIWWSVCILNPWEYYASHFQVPVLLCAYVIFLCPWCNVYGHRKETRQSEFESWTRLFSFHIGLIPFGKIWIPQLSIQLWMNNNTIKWAFNFGMTTNLRERKLN